MITSVIVSAFPWLCRHCSDLLRLHVKRPSAKRDSSFWRHCTARFTCLQVIHVWHTRR